VNRTAANPMSATSASRAAVTVAGAETDTTVAMPTPSSSPPQQQQPQPLLSSSSSSSLSSLRSLPPAVPPRNDAGPGDDGAATIIPFDEDAPGVDSCFDPDAQGDFLYPEAPPLTCCCCEPELPRCCYKRKMGRMYVCREREPDDHDDGDDGDDEFRGTGGGAFEREGGVEGGSDLKQSIGTTRRRRRRTQGGAGGGRGPRLVCVVGAGWGTWIITVVGSLGLGVAANSFGLRFLSWGLALAAVVLFSLAVAALVGVCASNPGVFPRYTHKKHPEWRYCHQSKSYRPPDGTVR
jgi:hypothetical protein